MTTLRNRILVIAVPMTLFVAAGCVGVKNETAHRSWPKPVAVAETKQFDGVFGNRSLDATTGKASDKSHQLFDFLTSRGHFHFKRGTEVELRSSADGTFLDLHLFDEEHLEIDSARLQRGVDFDLSGGFMSLHGPFSGFRSEAGNMATGLDRQSSHLYVSSTGALLGKRTGSAAGLLFYFVPFASRGKDWMLWPNLSQETSK